MYNCTTHRRAAKLFAVIGVLFLSFSLPSQGGEESTPTYFQFTANTGENGTVIIPVNAVISVNGLPIEIGDEIGVFTPDSLCVGAIVWAENNNVITVWENNPQTQEKDGIEIGEQMHFRIWKRDLRTEFLQTQLKISNQAPSSGDDIYRRRGIYAIDTLHTDVILSVPERIIPAPIPEQFALYQNFPNPFNPSTTIRYEVKRASNVKIIVYNVIGQEVQVLVNNHHEAGVYEVTFSGTALSSGIYFYRMEADEFVMTKNFILLQ